MRKGISCLAGAIGIGALMFLCHKRQCKNGSRVQ